MIPDVQVEEVRAHADLVEVIGELVSLKKSGKEFKANCPFHEERTPSFYVVPAKGFYKCFGCGESGDIFSFVMKRLGLDFVEAVRYVAARSGVEIHEVSRGQDAEEDPHRAHFEANSFARDFFRSMLLDPRIGKDARDYLGHRGIDEATAERFGLGYAPDEWRSLRAAAAKLGIADDLLVEVGLLTTSEKSPEPYDRFRHRIMFPIEGLTAGWSRSVVAFSGVEARSAAPGRIRPSTSIRLRPPSITRGRCFSVCRGRSTPFARKSLPWWSRVTWTRLALATAGFENVVAPLARRSPMRRAPYWPATPSVFCFCSTATRLA